MNLLHEICSGMTAPESTLLFGEEQFTATAEGVLFHPVSGNLLVSDCHFGKTTHFRKNALPVPEQAIEKDFNRLEEIVIRLNPSGITFLGDLFHSFVNREWDLLSNFFYTRIPCKRTLILGNHDILSSKLYEDAGFHVKTTDFIGQISLIHDVSDKTAESKFSISGHLHPGYRIKGSGRQQFSLPCFYVGEKDLIMPAFGSLTGLFIMEKKRKTDRIFCFTSNSIFEVI
jgi:DNA ligase-associated metallophosphoesterase